MHVYISDTCHLKHKLQNLVQGGTTSYLYCYLLPNSLHKFIHPVLLPVSLYIDKGRYGTHDNFHVIFVTFL